MMVMMDGDDDFLMQWYAMLLYKKNYDDDEYD